MKKISMLCMSFLLLCGCSNAPALEKHNDTMLDVGFDTFVTLLAYSEDDETYAKYQESARAEYIRYNQLFDRYNTYEGVNNVKTINDNAGIAPIKVDPEIIDVLNLAKTYADQSDNQYNVTFGAVLEIWHKYREEAKTSAGRIPSAQELSAAKQHTGWDKIEIDEQAQTVYIKDAKASLDLGSVAKGYATEKVALKLQAEGLKHGIINAGGNVRIIGDKPDGDHWSVGLQIPSGDDDASLADVAIKADMSFVTSGDYQRFYEVNGQRLHHIIDPHTLSPATHMRSVTIVTSDSGIADILSTTLFTMTYEEGSTLLTKLREQGMKVEAIWVFDDTTELPANTDFVTSGTYQIAISDGLKNTVTVK